MLDKATATAHSLLMRLGIIIGLLLPLALPAQVSAHPGGLNSEGCHNNRKTGSYHCHGGQAASRAPARPQKLTGGDSHFASCAAARAAGAAPLRRGDAGYRAGLDRDNDGVACE